MQFLHFDSLRSIPGLRHAVTTRGGTCRDAYDALNLAYHVGDDAARVSENRRKVAEILGYDATYLVAAQQAHGPHFCYVRSTLRGRGSFDWKSAIPNYDAMVTQESHVPLLIQVADCAPVLLVDAKNHVLSVIHAGWRGAVGGIIRNVSSWIRWDDTIPLANMYAGIGPCLCPDCFEIGPEVVEEAQKIAPEAILQRDEWQKPHLDLRLLIQRDLESIGVLPQNIEVMSNCPRCDNETFFSHRGQNGIAGRFGLVAWWEE